ncbi:HlyD family secretion protein [Biformimicrobium ophioploci]|uniref:RND efflux pump membrane fusion protein barrel-sandwich domain-containing protein n=1 Tax=Biformimicrobium ophioploci TaxID=3036711 RepID=A0ABQ6LYB4_9GAMM|nr:HlyD family efflux transporter periplasmic adaptor subunit [Microbulbifer sp. NKW57]GMG87064.1 hypothetical protein MNKW57_13850 [Microbulbifer sp. NKW57]
MRNRLLYISLYSIVVLAGCTDEVRVQSVAGEEAPLLTSTGEFASARSVTVTAPAISRMWNFNIKRMVGENTVIDKGTMLVAFDDKNVRDRLLEKQSELERARTELKNKVSEEEKVRQDDALNIAEKRAGFEKARRKAEIVDQSLSRNERKKAQIDFEIAENELALARQLAEFRETSGVLNIGLIEKKVEFLEAETAQLSNELKRLRVRSPIAGSVQYLPDWQGEKPAVGETVRLGQPVLKVSVLDEMQVITQVAESELGRIAIGQPVEIVLEGNALSSVEGRVEKIGGVVRDKSKGDNRRVVDVLLSLERQDTETFRPGMTVNVEFLAAEPVNADAEIAGREE